LWSSSFIFSKGDSAAGQRKIPVFRNIGNEPQLWVNRAEEAFVVVGGGFSCYNDLTA